MMFSSLNPMRLIANRATVLALILAVDQGVNAHSWVEQAYNIAPNGTFVGAPGYIRGWFGRDRERGFNDDLFTHRLLDLTADNNVCAPIQKAGKYTNEFPMLTTSPGNFISLRYLENGHVSLLGQPKHPTNRGTVFIYGTTEASNDDKFKDIQKWNADGTGGNKKGKLIATRNFDDMRCYEANGSNITLARQAAIGRTGQPNDNAQGQNQWCQNDFQIPSDVAVTTKDKPYTIYWVWSWPEMNREGCPNDQVDPANNCDIARIETYTSCFDVNIVAANPAMKADGPVAYAANNNPNSAAVPDQMTVGPFQVVIPSLGAVGTGGGNNGAKPTSTRSDGIFMPSKSAAPTSAAPSKPTDNPKPNDPVNNDGVKTVTVTVPAAYVTVYESEGAPAPKPTSTASATKRPARRQAGEWGLGH